MKVKKFTARTFSEALELVKKELSQDAVILSTEERKGLRPQVEVTAAVDYDEEIDGNEQFESADFHPSENAGTGGPRTERRKPQPEKAASQGNDAFQPWYAYARTKEQRAPKAEILKAKPEPQRPSVQEVPDEQLRSALRTPPAAQRSSSVRASSKEPGTVGPSQSDLKSEINDLRAMIEGLKNNGYGLSLPAKKRAMMNYLTERSVREEFALRLCDRAAEISEIPHTLSADIKIKRHSGTRKAVMLIGPTGVGKTTTIAKLAAQAVRAGKKASIINLDTYRIGAAEQSKIYARILGIPLAVATNEEEFRSNLSRFSETRDVVFIDTTGRNPRDEAYIRDLAGLCKAAAPLPMELHLLMSAGGDDEFMIEAYRSYRHLPIDYIAFTKIDEAVRYGSLYNLLLTYQKPVAYLTTGQRVPGDLEYVTVNRLANLIVSKECNPC